MSEHEPPRNRDELMARARKSRERIAAHHKAMADVAAQAAANNASNAQDGGDNT